MWQKLLPEQSRLKSNRKIILPTPCWGGQAIDKVISDVIQTNEVRKNPVIYGIPRHDVPRNDSEKKGVILSVAKNPIKERPLERREPSFMGFLVES